MSRHFSGHLNGVNYHVKYEAPGGDIQGLFTISIAAGSTLRFTATRGGGITSSLLRLNPANFDGRRRVITGVPEFDERAVLYSGQPPELILDYFRDQRNLNAILTLFRLGFDSVVSDLGTLQANRSIYFWIPQSGLKIIKETVPCLTTLAGNHSVRDNGAQGRVLSPPHNFPPQKEIASFFEERRNPRLAFWLGAFPLTAPFAYWYAGGWRYMVLFLPALSAAVFAFLQLPDYLNRAIMLLWLVMAWKTEALASVRSRLMDEGRIAESNFNSFRIASHAILDFALGIATAVGPALVPIYIATRMHPDNTWNLILFIESVPIWLICSLLLALSAERIVGWVLVRVLGPKWIWGSPFFEEQKTRWGKSDGTTMPKSGAVTGIGGIMPSWAEFRRAWNITIVMPFLVAMGFMS